MAVIPWYNPNTGFPYLFLDSENLFFRISSKRGKEKVDKGEGCMDLKLNKKTALVTASTGGIGMEIARYLAREGATVIVNGRTSQTITRACENINSGNSDIKLLQLIADNGTAD
jgi:FlaA1/EpsC-like NDP-sugar epimerase